MTLTPGNQVSAILFLHFLQKFVNFLTGSSPRPREILNDDQREGHIDRRIEQNGPRERQGRFEEGVGLRGQVQRQIREENAEAGDQGTQLKWNKDFC